MIIFDDSDAFKETAISYDEVMGAVNRFVAYREGENLVFRLVDDFDGDDIPLLSKDEVLHLLAKQLEAGAQVQLS